MNSYSLLLQVKKEVQVHVQVLAQCLIVNISSEICNVILQWRYKFTPLKCFLVVQQSTFLLLNLCNQPRLHCAPYIGYKNPHQYSLKIPQSIETSLVTTVDCNNPVVYQIFPSADEKYFYKCPDRLRLPLIFYLAHTASVFVNKMMLAGLIEV